MKLTNKYNLPGPIVNAVNGFNKAYQNSRGNTQISVTQLIQPPLIRNLTKEHYDEIEEDVSDRIWSLLGSAVHSILEHAGTTNDLTEERLFAEIDGVRISGQGDLYEADGTLSDYKITSVWSVIGDKIKPEWEQQLNILNYLYTKAGFPAKKLQIVSILRDWSKAKGTYDSTYPDCNIKVIDIPMWNMEKIENFIKERIAIHKSAEVVQCTEVERWSKPDVYAVMKKGRKSAIKLYDNLAEAEADKRGEYVDHRPGVDTRCEGYCPVKQWCPFKKE